MVVVNTLNVIRLLMVTFDIANNNNPTPVNNHEVQLHDIIKDMLLDVQKDTSFSLEIDTTLEFLNPVRPHSVDFVDDVYAPTREEILEAMEAEDEQCVPEESGIVTLEYKTTAVEYWKSGKTKRLTLATVQKKFRKVSTLQQLYRWEETVNRGGTRREKLLQISESVYNKFVESIDSGDIIHDLDIQRWALQANQGIDLENFKASRHWVWNFKKAYRIVSRKINKFITRSYGTDSEKLNEIALTFVSHVKDHIKQVGEDNTFNADESGFNLELHSGRTLAVQGSKRVTAVVQSISATTHSYTILPTISPSGKLLSPLFIVMKEQSGSFGPRVTQSLFEPWNVYVRASTSGKLTKELFNEWLTRVYVPNVGAQSVLFLDSWTGHCPATLQKSIPSNKHVEILTIPKKTTAMIQPLDVYGFRIWKNFVRKFSDLVLLFGYDIVLHERNNVIKLQSLIHNQLSAPKYHDVFAYARYKSGYIDQKPNKFENPVAFAFRQQDFIHPASCSICGAQAIIRCAWCNEFLCFKHFFEEFHHHTE